MLYSDEEMKEKFRNKKRIEKEQEQVVNQPIIKKRLKNTISKKEIDRLFRGENRSNGKTKDDIIEKLRNDYYPPEKQKSFVSQEEIDKITDRLYKPLKTKDNMVKDLQDQSEKPKKFSKKEMDTIIDRLYSGSSHNYKKEGLYGEKDKIKEDSSSISENKSMEKVIDNKFDKKDEKNNDEEVIKENSSSDTDKNKSVEEETENIVNKEGNTNKLFGGVNNKKNEKQLDKKSVKEASDGKLDGKNDENKKKKIENEVLIVSEKSKKKEISDNASENKPEKEIEFDIDNLSENKQGNNEMQSVKASVGENSNNENKLPKLLNKEQYKNEVDVKISKNIEKKIKWKILSKKPFLKRVEYYAEKRKRLETEWKKLKEEQVQAMINERFRKKVKKSKFDTIIDRLYKGYNNDELKGDSYSDKMKKRCKENKYKDFSWQHSGFRE